MNINVDETLLWDCHKKWGTDAQLGVAVEECAEFIKAAMKFSNRGGDIGDLMAETADALFLLLQMRYILGEDNIDFYLQQTQDKVRSKLDEPSTGN